MVHLDRIHVCKRSRYSLHTANDNQKFIRAIWPWYGNNTKDSIKHLDSKFTNLNSVNDFLPPAHQLNPLLLLSLSPRSSQIILRTQAIAKYIAHYCCTFLNDRWTRHSFMILHVNVIHMRIRSKKNATHTNNHVGHMIVLLDKQLVLFQLL